MPQEETHPHAASLLQGVMDVDVLISRIVKLVKSA
jgi:hypothetical protein